MNHSADTSYIMPIKFTSNPSSGWKNFIFLISITLFLFPVNIKSQTLTNLEVFYSLSDSLVHQLTTELPANEKKILLTLNLGESYSLFENQFGASFVKYRKEILETPPDDLNIPHINIVLEGAGVEYGEMFKDGWFGSHYIQRYSTIFGNYLQNYSEEGRQLFEITKLDTVKVEDIKNLENDSFPFTKSNVPAEPFLSGFAEPLIAIGTAAAVVALFFIIRSE